MTDISHLRARAEELRAAARTATDPDVVDALQEVAAAFEREAQDEAVWQALPGHDPDTRDRVA